MTERPDELHALAATLLSNVESIGSSSESAEPVREVDHRDAIVRALEVKILPELRAGYDLPVFLAVQGGTNVGKSTVFNALAGELLSPSVVQASATKHPLVYVHESWKERLLTPETFPALEFVELSDPKELLADADETQRVYVRGHAKDELGDLAIVDSPDFDSALVQNLEVAKTVTALSDLTVFVTSQEKYKDRELVRRLEILLAMKASVVLVFNRVDEDIVFQTLLSDLRETVTLPPDLLAVRVPRSTRSHPEDEVRDVLREPVLERVLGSDARSLKPALVSKALSRTLDDVDALARLHAQEASVGKRYERLAKKAVDEAVREYRDEFQLALPEETLAIRAALRVTEIGSRLKLSKDVESTSTALSAVGTSIGRVADVARRLMLRLVHPSEGSLDESPHAAKEYAESRDEGDFQRTSHRGMLVRQEIESYFRESEKRSPVARRMTSEFFVPSTAREFPGELRAVYDRETDERRPRGEAILDQTKRWIADHPGACTTIAWSSFIAKIGAGVLLAWVVPPDGIFNFLTWLAFAAGYLLAAYGIALTISFRLSRRKRFRAARIEGFRATLENGVLKPITETIAEMLSQPKIDAMRETSKALAERIGAPDTETREKSEAGEEARD